MNEPQAQLSQCSFTYLVRMDIFKTSMPPQHLLMLEAECILNHGPSKDLSILSH